MRDSTSEIVDYRLAVIGRGQHLSNRPLALVYQLVDDIAQPIETLVPFRMEVRRRLAAGVEKPAMHQTRHLSVSIAGQPKIVKAPCSQGANQVH